VRRRNSVGGFDTAAAAAELLLAKPAGEKELLFGNLVELARTLQLEAAERHGLPPPPDGDGDGDGDDLLARAQRAKEGEDGVYDGLRLPVWGPRCPEGLRQATYRVTDFQTVMPFGSGDDTQVFVAEHRATRTPCVLKAYRKGRGARADTFARRAISLHARLWHWNLVNLHVAFEDEGRYYAVMEFAGRRSLADLAAEHGGRVPEAAVAAEVAAPLARVLVLLHRAGLVHRDIKGDNCMYTEDGVLKLADFDFLIDARVERPLLRTGTPGFMAPEIFQFSDEVLESRPYDSAADVFSLGVTLFRLLCGRHPFPAQEQSLTSEGGAGLALGGSPVFPAEPALSAECRDFLSACLKWDPLDRPASLGLLAHPWLAPHAEGFAELMPEPSVELTPAQRELLAADAVATLQAARGRARERAVEQAADVARVILGARTRDDGGAPGAPRHSHVDRLVRLLKLEGVQVGAGGAAGGGEVAGGGEGKKTLRGALKAVLGMGRVARGAVGGDGAAGAPGGSEGRKPTMFQRMTSGFGSSRSRGAARAEQSEASATTTTTGRGVGARSKGSATASSGAPPSTARAKGKSGVVV